MSWNIIWPLKRDEILTLTTTCPEDTMLSEIDQTQKDIV